MRGDIFTRIRKANIKWMIDSDFYTIEHKRGQFSEWTPGSGIETSGFKWYMPFHVTTTGKDHTYFVLDYDTEILDDISVFHGNELLLREAKLRVTLSFIKQWLDQHPEYNFFAKISGSGVHLIQRLDERIDPRRMETVVKNHLFKKCEHAPSFAKATMERPEHACDATCVGWHHPYDYVTDHKYWKPWVSRWTKYVEIDGIKARITVDLGMFYTAHMIRWTYSRNMKLERLNYAIPIDEWDIDWVLRHMYREDLQVHEYEIPQFQFYNLLASADAYPTQPKPTKDEKYAPGIFYRIDVPEPEERDRLTPVQQYKIEKMDLLLQGDETEVPPCVTAWYHRTRFEKGIFWGRFVWVRWLANTGYSPEDIALLMRFKVNDEIDNNQSNRKKLHKHMPNVYGPRDNPDKMMGCAKLQYHGEPTRMEIKIATEEMCAICKRTYPMQAYKEFRTPEEEEMMGFIEIQRKCREILDDYRGRNVVARKATRAGVTTTMIPMSKLLGRKLLVVVPTNRIGKETFVKAVELCKTKFDVTVRGAMFAANKNSCLVLSILGEEVKRKRRESIDPDWDPTLPLAWTALRYHSKPSCEKCKYREMEFPVPIFRNDVPVPMIDSEITVYKAGLKQSQGTCAYITLYNQIRNIDVIFITYSKLFALFSTQSEQADFMKQELFECFDVVMLDEVSHLTNHSALTIKLLQRKADLPSDPKAGKYADYRENLLFELLKEIPRLLNFKESKVTKKIADYVERFIEHYEHFLDDPVTTEEIKRMTNFLEIEEIEEIKENFTAYHDIIERAALHENISLTNLEGVLFLLKEYFWMLSSVPTKFNPVDISLVAAPATGEIKAFVRDVSNDETKQIVVTDATMPFVNMMDFFQIPFEQYEIGDPRGTNKTQLVIADSRNVNIIDLFFSEKKGRLQADLLQYIIQVANAHGPENVMIVCPNKSTYYWMSGQRKSGVIPKELDLTYYRSDKTIGVESDRRVMIPVCPAFPPKGSHDWLAFYFHSDGIYTHMPLKALGRELTSNNAKAAFYQTIGRAKDPEVKKRSMVYCWGISGGRSRHDQMGARTVFEMMDFDDDVPKPHVFPSSHVTARTDMMIKVGKIWINDGALIDPFIVRVAGIVRRYDRLTESQLERKMGPSVSKKQIDEVLSFDNIPLLEHFGVRVHEEYSARAKSKSQKVLRYEGISSR